MIFWLGQSWPGYFLLAFRFKSNWKGHRFKCLNGPHTTINISGSVKPFINRPEVERKLTSGGKMGSDLDKRNNIRSDSDLDKDSDVYAFGSVLFILVLRI